MLPVDYDKIASAYDQRYAVNAFAGIEQCLRTFLGHAPSIAELGCGTGHWLQFSAELPHRPLVVGLDRASAMLARCPRSTPNIAVVRGSADQLPWRPGFDRVFCVNALHHFPSHPTVFREGARVLREDGAFLTIGLDPHAGGDQWWIYDYFPEALTADRARYSSTRTIRDQLIAAGFRRTETIVAQHIPARVPFDDALAQGILDRRSASQLLVIDDATWKAGLGRLHRDRPELRADLRLYATIGWRA
jgi:ubiquinone/menaquinone biosynthesis C-methylase UbiE